MASAMFKEHCNKVLIDVGFRATTSDPGLYIKQLDSGQYVYIFVHVDDFEIISPTTAIGTEIMTEMSKIYNLTTENEVDFHLGMVLTRDRSNKSITISQPGYTDEIDKSFNLVTAFMLSKQILKNVFDCVLVSLHFAQKNPAVKNIF